MIVKSDSFCEGKFNPQYLLEADYDHLDKIRSVVVDKIIDNKTLHEKEFEACPK